MRRSRLYQRVFLLNASILVIATLVLVLTPATVSFPVEATEAIVLVVGLGAILVVNAVAVRAVFGPLDRLMRLMRSVDPYRPSARLEVTGPQEVSELALAFNEMLDRLETERYNSRRRALEAQESERKRVASELHDEAGQLVTAILIQLETLAERAPDELMPSVRQIQDTARRTIDVLSRVVRELRPEALDELGLANALAALVDRVEEQFGLAIATHVDPDIGHLDPERELVIYRVAQESLTNVVRHARATAVDLTLERTEQAVRLSIRDNGTGFTQPLVARHGIAGMRERAALIGASLAIDNAYPGIVVTLTVPDR